MRISRFIPFIMLLALCFSCKPQVPDEYLQPDEFEDVLYDYHWLMPWPVMVITRIMSHMTLFYIDRPYYVNTE